MSSTADQFYENVSVLRCQGGAAAAFEELGARYTPRLRYYLRNLQDVRVEVFRGISQLARRCFRCVALPDCTGPRTAPTVAPPPVAPGS